MFLLNIQTMNSVRRVCHCLPLYSLFGLFHLILNQFILNTINTYNCLAMFTPVNILTAALSVIITMTGASGDGGDHVDCFSLRVTVCLWVCSSGWKIAYNSCTVGHRRQVTAVTRLPRWRRGKTRLQGRALLTMLWGVDGCDFWHARRYWI